MVSSTASTSSRVKLGEPVWDIARLYPLQGEWTEDEYLRLDTNQRVEFTDGCVEFLPMPKLHHQRIMMYLIKLLCELIEKPGLGEVLVAGTRVRARRGKYREPDVLVILGESGDRETGDLYLSRPDLVIEVVSEDDPNRDHVQKPIDYAEGRIPEYWIVDPRDESITVLTLDGEKYRQHGRFTTGQSATSSLLPQLTIDVQATFDAGRPRPRPRK